MSNPRAWSMGVPPMSRVFLEVRARHSLTEAAVLLGRQRRSGQLKLCAEALSGKCVHDLSHMIVAPRLDHELNLRRSAPGGW